MGDCRPKVDSDRTSSQVIVPWITLVCGTGPGLEVRPEAAWIPEGKPDRSLYQATKSNVQSSVTSEQSASLASSQDLNRERDEHCPGDLGLICSAGPRPQKGCRRGWAHPRVTCVPGPRALCVLGVPQ